MDFVRTAWSNPGRRLRAWPWPSPQLCSVGADRDHEAARRTDATPEPVARWLKRTGAGGLAAVLADHPRKKPMRPEAIAAARAEIAAVLKRRLRRRLRSRLNAIDAVLASEPPEIAAAFICAQTPADSLDRPDAVLRS